VLDLSAGASPGELMATANSAHTRLPRPVSGLGFQVIESGWFDGFIKSIPSQNRSLIVDYY